MPWDTKRDALREGASYLVQTSAIDSLSAFPGDDTLAAAMRLSASRHPLVRGYAYICVGMAGRSLTSLRYRVTAWTMMAPSSGLVPRANSSSRNRE